MQYPALNFTEKFSLFAEQWTPKLCTPWLNGIFSFCRWPGNWWRFNSLLQIGFAHLLTWLAGWLTIILLIPEADND